MSFNQDNKQLQTLFQQAQNWQLKVRERLEALEEFERRLLTLQIMSFFGSTAASVDLLSMSTQEGKALNEFEMLSHGIFQDPEQAMDAWKGLTIEQFYCEGRWNSRVDFGDLWGEDYVPGLLGDNDRREAKILMQGLWTIRGLQAKIAEASSRDETTFDRNLFIGLLERYGDCAPDSVKEELQQYPHRERGEETEAQIKLRSLRYDLNKAVESENDRHQSPHDQSVIAAEIRRRFLGCVDS